MLDFSNAEMFAGLAILVSVIRYGTYLWSIYKGETRPHVFSWFNWGVVTGIGAYAQFALNGGPSAWVLVVVSCTCLFISVVALFVGEKNIAKSDWWAFLGALIAIPVWMITDSPAMAIIVIIVIDILTYYPTLRKSWNDPWSEPPVSYFWAGLRYFLALFAVTNPSLETLAYPFFLMATDWGFMIYIIIRRRILEKVKHA
ncbi:MAG: hypothetical protein COB76_01805 [Alphaproteobacteria bacterium]|nr:MAG: hypothetical protein COB76_01805 [Alphaproteobacteria bacterium]